MKEVSNPTVKRWLRQLDLEGTDKAPDADTFRSFVDKVEKHLEHLQSDRDLLTRTLEMSTEEMNQLHKDLKAQRDQLEAVVKAAADALSVFSEVGAGEGTASSDISAAMTVARTKFATRLSEVVDKAGGERSNSGSIRGLQRAFFDLADQLTSLVQGTSEAAALREQLEVAGAVQRMLVPERAEQSYERFELAAAFRPASTCGGDWWTVHPLSDDKYLVVIADVTGHGVPSAIITGAAKGATDLARTATRGVLPPGQLLRMLNKVIASASRRQYMMTAVALVVEPTGVLIANAGHPAPLLVRNGQIKPIVGDRDPPLGSVGNHPYGETRLEVDPGDHLFLYTDGVTEFVNRAKEEFSERRLRALLLKGEKDSPEALRARVVDGLDLFGDGAAQEDDVTFVALRFKG